MKILEFCTNYFYGFQDIAYYKQNDAETNTLAVLKIISYFTVLIPLFVAALFTAASLCGRVSKIESLSPQDFNISSQAGKVITKRKATPQEIRDAAKRAAEGKFIHTGPNGHSYEKLLDMVRGASIKEISYVIEGALSDQYSTGLKKALGELLRCRDRFGGFSDKEKLKLSIKTITEEKLLELVDKSELPPLNKPFDYRITFDRYNNLELELLQKYAKELCLSDGGIKQIREYIEHIKALCEKTKDQPRFMWE